MDKQLPAINNDPIVQKYMQMLLQLDKKKEYHDTEEFLQYIEIMEKQFDEVIKELHDIKKLMNEMQNPTMKTRLKNAVDKTQNAIDTGKNKLEKLKANIISSMKECLESFKKRGKDEVVKTIDILHFKEALGGIRKSLFIAMNKTNEVIHTCDAMTSEIRNAKRNFRNVGLLMLGKPIQKDSGDKNRLNLMQKSSRSVHLILERMVIKTTRTLHKLEDFEKPSVKSEIKLLTGQSKSHDSKIHEKKEQSR